MNRYVRLLIALGFTLFFAKTHLAADSAKDASPNKQNSAAEPAGGTFLRLIRNDKGVVQSMQTSIAHYIPNTKDQSAIKVDLISAVHIGEKEYYAKLNKAFKGYDAVLYELVAPEGTKIPEGGGERRGVVSDIQGMMKDMLNLEFQLEQVNYQKDNFVHADLSPEKFSEEMGKRGDTVLSMMFRMMGSSMAMQSDMQAKGQSNDYEMLFALFSSDRPLKLRRAMAAQFENLDVMTQMFGGPNGSILIEGRNQAALKVLKNELADGKKKIAIFYGGGHMKDMEKHLLKDFGFKFTGEDWLEAWNMRDKTSSTKTESKEKK